MADLFVGLSRAAIPRLAQEPVEEGGIRAWLVKGNYRLARTSTPSLIVLEDIQLAEIIPYIEFDYSRFALASFESFSTSKIEASRHSLLGWPLLKLYYSAFFAAHAVMRATGSGVVKLERAQALFLDQYIEVMTGTSIGIKPGMFVFRLSQNSNRTISIILQTHSNGAGVHDSFWRVFDRFLVGLAENAVSVNATYAADFVSGISDLSPYFRIDSRPGGSVWFSSVRNEINYQHKYDIWYPLKNSKKYLSMMSNLAILESSCVRLDISLIDDPIGAFISLSYFLASLNRDLAENVSVQSNSTRSFGGRWRRFNETISNW